jgi:tRNA (guanine26-N2/guanine27-N2)-dimethyltransferase
MLDLKRECTVCGAKVRIAGPLYIHAIKENVFCEQVHEELGKRELGKKSEAMKLVDTCIHELDIPYYFEHHAICKALKIPPPPIASLIDALRSAGFHASRTHFSDIAIKTDARIDAINDVLRGL